jgi:hypothetical protein
MNMLRLVPSTGFLLVTQKPITSCFEELQEESIKNIIQIVAIILIDFIEV